MEVSNWADGIRNSNIFMVVGTRKYFEDAVCFCQAELAKELNKPFRILLERGIEIPSDFLEGISDLKIVEWSGTSYGLSKAINQLLGDIIPKKV